MNNSVEKKRGNLEFMSPVKECEGSNNKNT